jgi:hypothetical protein
MINYQNPIIMKSNYVGIGEIYGDFFLPLAAPAPRSNGWSINNENEV